MTATQDRESRLKELRVELKKQTDVMDGIVNAAPMEDVVIDGVQTKGMNVTTAAQKQFTSAKRVADQVKSQIDMITGTDELTAYLEGKDGGASSVAAAASRHLAGLGQMPFEGKTLGQAFLESEAFDGFRVKGFNGNMDRGFEVADVDLGSMLQAKDLYTSLPGTMTNLGFGSTQREPMVPRQFRTARVRDLFPVAQTSANLIEFFKVTGFTNASAPVPERANGAFGLKPQSELDFEPDQAAVRTIAHYEVAHRNVLDDEPGLRSTIDNELLYGLRLTEDAQILSGDGTGQNLRGILNTPGIQDYEAPLVEGKAMTRTDAIRKAITRSILAYYDPTGLVLHPFDWEEVELQKDNQGAYIVTAAVAVGAAKQIWRLPVVDTPAIAQGTYLVGSFGIGAQLYDRMQANIRIAEQHADFFIRNAVAILAEERLALAVKRPESFVKMRIKQA